MRIIARRTRREFWEAHPDAEEPLRTWYTYGRQADWRNPSDVMDRFLVLIQRYELEAA